MLTHCYSGAPNNAGNGTNIVQAGKLPPAPLAAKRRGVMFDIGHSGGNFDHTIADGCHRPGLPARHDLAGQACVFGQQPRHAPFAVGDAQADRAGISLPEVVAMTTSAPGQVIGRLPQHDTLQIGAPADLSILERVDDPVGFVDTRNPKRSGPMHLRPSGTIVASVAFGRC